MLELSVQTNRKSLFYHPDLIRIKSILQIQPGREMSDTGSASLHMGGGGDPELLIPDPDRIRNKTKPTTRFGFRLVWF